MSRRPRFWRQSGEEERGGRAKWWWGDGAAIGVLRVGGWGGGAGKEGRGEQTEWEKITDRPKGIRLWG